VGEFWGQLKKFNLIKEMRHGFVQKKLCLTNMLEFLEHVTNDVDQGFPIDVIYDDFQKAFDKVPHERLMLKLRLEVFLRKYTVGLRIG
jgi:hypothetical protein